MAFQYAVKFICGSPPVDGPVAPGEYFTAINVHNPTEQTVEFKKRFSIARERERPGPFTEFFPAKLEPNQALEIDCADIREHTANIFEARFRKGFAVILTEVELDVVAVYTAAGSFGKVKTLYLERVPPRRM